jgi:hypothetical protein
MASISPTSFLHAIVMASDRRHHLSLPEDKIAVKIDRSFGY